LLFLAAMGALYSTLPPSPDQFEVDYLGWRLLHGARPYVDFIDPNWPGIFWLHSLSTLLFGNTMYAWRVMDYVLMLTGVLFLADWLRRTCSVQAAVWTLFLYPALYITTGSWFAGQRDILLLHLGFVSFWLDHLAWSRRRPAWQFGTGAVIALATLVKPTAVLIGVALALANSWTRRLRFREAVMHLLAGILGAALALFAALLLLMLQGSTLSAFWAAAVEFNRPEYRLESATAAHLLGVLWKAYAVSWHWIGVGALLTLIWLLRGTRSETSRREGAEAPVLLPLIWAAGFASFVVQGQGFWYHLGVCYAATIPLLCIGLGALSEHLRSAGPYSARVVAAAVCLVPILGTAKKLAGTYLSVAALTVGQGTWEGHLARFSGGDGMNMQQVVSLSTKLRAIVPTGEPVLVWGTASAINFLAERPQPTRFYYFPVLVAASPTFPRAALWQEWFREDLEREPPLVCVVSKQAIGPEPKRTMDSILYLKEYLAAGYNWVERIGERDGVDIYVRKSAAGISW
jgi:hypothetical protein